MIFTTRDIWGYDPTNYYNKWIADRGRSRDNSDWMRKLPIMLADYYGKRFALSQRNPIDLSPANKFNDDFFKGDPANNKKTLNELMKKHGKTKKETSKRRSNKTT